MALSNASSNGHIRGSFVIPILLIILIPYALMFLFIEIRHDILAEQNKDKDLVFEAKPNHQGLVIKRPDGCYLPTKIPELFSIYGRWNFDQVEAKLECSERRTDHLSIDYAANSPRSVYLMRDNPNYKLIRKEGKFSFYDWGLKDHIGVKALTFIGADGEKVLITHLVGMNTNLLIYRRLNNDFELTYSIHDLPPTPEKLYQYDRQILAFAKSITHPLIESKTDTTH